MKAVLVILVFGTIVAAESEKKSIMEKVDVNEVMDNERILINYLKCFLEEGPCTAEGLEVKKILGEFKDSGVVCDGCSDKEKEALKKVLVIVKEKHTDMWDKLMAKYAAEKKISESVMKFME